MGSKIYDNIPRRYHLLWDSDHAAIIIRIHRACLQSMKPLSGDHPMVKLLSQRHSIDIDGLFGSFSGDLATGSFGFGQAIKKLRDHGEYIDFSASIPRIEIQTALACKKCSATGHRFLSGELAFQGDRCLHCKGSGKKYISDWDSPIMLTCSLRLLFDALDFMEGQTSADEKQYIAVRLLNDQGKNGSSLDGWFGAELMNYIAANPRELESIIRGSVKDAMLMAHRRMFIGDDHDQHKISVDFHNGSVGLKCAGNACEISTESGRRTDTESVSFSCHNADNQAQQLTLLAGLASLISQVGSLVILNERFPAKE